MTNLRDIREALAAKIADGIHRAVNVNPYKVDNIPCVNVLPSTLDYHGTFGPNRTMEFVFTVEVLWFAGEDVSAQIAVDDLLWSGSGEASSIIDALETVADGDNSPSLDLGDTPNNVTVYEAVWDEDKTDEGAHRATLRVGVLIGRT